MVKPDVSNGNFHMGTDTDDFVSVGKGWVGGDIPDPNNSDVNNGKFDISAYPNWEYTPPTNTSQYPTVTYQNRQYSYWDKESPRPENNYYTITWYRYSNAYASESEGNVWHVDGYVSLNDWPSVAYRVHFPNKDGFDWVDSSGKVQNDASYSYVKRETTFIELGTTPSMSDQDEYAFDGWYTDEGCTDKVNDSTPITEDTIFHGRYVKKGPDLTVTKELTKVVRDEAELTGALSDDTTLYAGDVVTWEITVTNGTDTPKSYSLSDDIEYVSSENQSFSAVGTILWSDDSSESSFNQNEFTVQAGHTKTITAQYTIEDYYGGYTLTNTATVTAKVGTAEAEDSTSNPIGHILTVTYNGNGGTVDGTATGATTVQKTVYAPTVPYTYTVETGNLGFQKEGHTFDSWYKDDACTKPAETDSLYSTATYYAGWTKDEEPVDPETDIFFFISLPSNDEAMSGSENDYRYLTHGGVIDETEKDLDVVKTTGITSLDDESAITRFVKTWPAGEDISLGNTEDVKFDIASPSVETGSSWTIDEYGNVTEFSIVITDEKGDTETYTSKDFGIRWAKISYATTAAPNDPDLNDSKRYHVDGVLYKKETVSDVLTNGNFQKTVDSETLSYNNDGTLKSEEEFSFVLDMLTGKDGQLSDAFKDIALTATVTNVGTSAQIGLPTDSKDGDNPLTPGYYVIQETLEGDQVKAWTTPASIYFELTSNGNVVITDSKNTITNTLETYTLTYNLGGATGDAPTGGTYYYNQKAPVAAAPAWTGHTFMGWSDGAATYQPGDPIRITTDTTLTAQWDTIQYNLTYNANGGTGAPGPDTNLPAGLHTLNSTTKPTYGSNIFLGWTADDSASGKIYEAGKQLPTIVPQVTIPDTDTVYAVWGADSNGDGTADAQQVLIVPADITVYQGGDGYDSVLDGTTEGSNVQSTGLPEPGYYITLPWQVNEDLKDAGAVADDEGIVNLSNYLSFTYNDGAGVERLWRIATYDADGNSRLSDGRYIYRILPDELTKTPIRLLFTNGAGDEFTSDDFFGIEDQLYDTLQMTIYRGDLEANYVQAQVVGTTALQDVGVGTGELVIRGTTNENPVSQIVTNAPSNVNQITAQAENVAYYINESPIQVQDPGTVRLLADELALTADTEPVMQEAAANAIQDTTLNNPQYDFMYLDLVDTSNGNAYVTLNQNNEDHAITIHWPMPANADPDSIHVVHFDGMDREFDVGDLSSYLGNVYEIENVDINGNVISFRTATFSPFVLVYEEDTSRPVNPNPGGGSGGDSDSDPTGNLSIELDVNGGDDEFTFTVILTDKDGDDLENNFYYNGDYTGTIGSGDEITLEGGDKIVIRNLPEGTRYEVIIETADGYTYVIDGEEGVIHTGMNEAEFTATRTVPVADPSVTGVSRWLNTTDHIAYLTGYPGGAFGPDNNMTRAEVAQMFYALLNNKNVTITKTFPDVPADAWYATAVNTLASLGMVSGDENGNYRPNDPITRAEFCVIALAFAYEPENAVCYFGDVSRSDWFYTYVAQAASYGWIGGYTNGNFGPNDRITRAQVTTIVNNMLGRAADRDYVIDHQADLVQFTDLTRAHWGYFQIMEATNAHDYTKSNGTENWR